MQLFRLPTWGKMLAIILVGLPIVVLGGALLRHVTNLPLGEAAQYAFYVLQNVPGALFASRLCILVLHHLHIGVTERNVPGALHAVPSCSCAAGSTWLGQRISARRAPYAVHFTTHCTYVTWMWRSSVG